MKMSKYQRLAARTTPVGTLIEELTHAALGIQSEGGEFADALKKHFFYKQPLDNINLHEELGDILWYVALAATALDISLDTIAEENLNKLKIRYPEKFTKECAKNRADKTLPEEL